MNNTSSTPVILQTGFRPFFLAAITFALVSMTQWTWVLYTHHQVDLAYISRTQWHGHEMVFGYATAVIAGFLLTAVQNWTGQKTAQGSLLLMLFMCWLGARLFALVPVQNTLHFVFLFSNLFYAGLLIVLLRPIIKTGNNAQWGIAGKLVLLWSLDNLMLCTAVGWLDTSYTSNILLVAVYTVVGLIMVMAQRVIPSFTRNAIVNKHNIVDYPRIPLLSLIFLLVFVVADVMQWQTVMLVSGIATAVVNVIRLYGWHDREIWRKPLLWVLYVAMSFITIGILMRATAHLTATLPSLGLHAMTYGGIGVMTTGMMARVSLGHTGRNVFNPPTGLGIIFLLLIAGAVVRSLLPLFLMDYYFLLILVSQIFWIGAFMLMLVFFLGPLTQPRADGKYG